MSWGASYDVTPGVGYENETTSGVDTDEHKMQYEIAREAAATVLNTGALGGPTKRYRVSFSGHANPDHEPTPGWANDFIQITITQQEN